MRTQTRVPVTRFNALVPSACFKVIVARADFILAPAAVVGVSASTPYYMTDLSVITSSTILTRVGYLALNIVLTMFACVVFKALTHVAVSLVDALAVVQADHAILTSSGVALTVKPA